MPRSKKRKAVSRKKAAKKRGRISKNKKKNLIKKKVNKTKAKRKSVIKVKVENKSPKKTTKSNIIKNNKASMIKPSQVQEIKKEEEKEKIGVRDLLMLQPPRGMRDILPGDQPYWAQVRKVLERLAKEYGFQRIDVPLVEYAKLFVRSVGLGTDIIEKEMYTFTTKGGDLVALRPELTSGVARAYIQHGMNVLSKPIKLFSLGQIYRYDRPQEGRYREHWQANFDIFGEQDPILDAQLIQVADRTLVALGIKNVQFQINSIGCADCRKAYLDLLVNYFSSKKQKLCQLCKKRLVGKNSLRILDCKEDKCVQVSSNAPQSVDHLCPDCRVHFKNFLEYLDELDLPYIINPRLVRGLNYYTKTVFEIWVEEGGKNYALGGGGRYDNLIKSLGGEVTPAIGFGLGLDRLVIEMKRIKAKTYEEPKPRVFLAQLGEFAKKKSLKMFSEIERNGILVAESFGRGSLKSQLRAADRMGVDITLIVGQKEAIDGMTIVKNMMTGTQETVANEKLIDLIKKMLKNNNVVVLNRSIKENKNASQDKKSDTATKKETVIRAKKPAKKKRAKRVNQPRRRGRRRK